MLKSQAYEWCKSFQEGREVVQDLLRSGRALIPTADDIIDEIKKLVLENHHFSFICWGCKQSWVHIRIFAKDEMISHRPDSLKRTTTEDESRVIFFPKLQLPLRRTQDVKQNSQRELKATPSSAYAKCMHDWVHGDQINFDEQS